ncbi:MAG: hypothetical protein L0958_06440 [Candidatus Mariimomonas ferrooxydans]
MKQIFIITALILGLSAVNSSAQMQGGMMGQDTIQTGKGQKQTGEMSKHGLCSQMMGTGMMGSGMGHGMMGCGMGHGMMGCGMGHGMMGYNAESYRKFLDGTAGLRKELHSKKFEYFEVLRNPKTKPETITKLEKKIQELQSKIYEKTKVTK